MSTYSTEAQELDEIIETLSSARLRPYLSFAGGNLKNALELYRWNLEVSGAFYEVLSVTEISLRNTLTKQLSTCETGRSGSWFDNPNGVFTGPALKDIQTARYRAERTYKSVSSDRIVAELNFGFWKYILAKRYETTLWTPCLRHGFPGLLKQHRQTVFETVSQLHFLRNRIAHHEPIYLRDLRKDYSRACDVVEWISKETHLWVQSFSRVEKTMATQPIMLTSN